MLAQLLFFFVVFIIVQDQQYFVASFQVKLIATFDLQYPFEQA